MKSTFPKTPKRYDTDIIDACQKLCGGSAVDVPIILEPYSKDAFCWFNVSEKIRIDGGEPVYGWMLVVYKELWIKALCHAVWKSANGTLIDVTPPQLPSLSSERSIFVADSSLQPFFADIQQGSPRPVERMFPFKFRKLWSLVAEKCKESDALRLAGKKSESKALLTHLENVLNGKVEA